MIKLYLPQQPHQNIFNSMCNILISFGEPFFSDHGPIFKHVLMANSVVKISVNIIFVVVVNPMSFLQFRLLHEPVIILIFIKLDNCLPSLCKSLKRCVKPFLDLVT